MNINIDFITISITLIIFALKLLFILLVTDILNKCSKPRGMNFVVAWAFSYLYEIAMMFCLSFAGRLYSIELIILCIISLIVVLVAYCLLVRKRQYKLRIGSIHFINVVITIVMIGFAAFCMIRSFVYFDTTVDANVYGMPRIFIFSSSGSLFVNMNTLAKNIFVNEWNGELNAVFYRIITGNNMSIPFANIEIYFYAMICFWLLGRELFKEKGICLSWIIMFLPVTVFLAFTCKGELLGIVSFPLFLLLLFLFWEEQRRERKNYILLAGVVMFGAIASGARITIIPAVGLIMVIILVAFLKEKDGRSIMFTLLLSTFSYLIGWGRYILNLRYYGNPFERVEVSNEALAPGLNRFFETLKAYINDIFWGENIFSHEGIMYALSADAGVVGCVTLLSSIVFIIYLTYRLLKKELISIYRKELGTMAVILFSLIFMLCSLDYYPWSFRYFAPYFLCIVIGLLYVLNYVRNKKIVSVCWKFVIVLGMISAYSTISLAGLQGEVTGDTSWENMLKKEEIYKRYAFHEWLVYNQVEECDIEDFYADIKQNKKILVCNNINQMISWCWGDNASNEVTLCIPEEFAEYCLLEDWDAIVASLELEINKKNIPLESYEKHVPYGLSFEVYVKE